MSTTGVVYVALGIVALLVAISLLGVYLLVRRLIRRIIDAVEKLWIAVFGPLEVSRRRSGAEVQHAQSDMSGPATSTTVRPPRRDPHWRPATKQHSDATGPRRRTGNQVWR